MTDTIQLGQARDAVSKTITVGILETMGKWYPPVLNSAKEVVPQNILAATKTFLGNSPITAILSSLPRYLQCGLSIVSTVLLGWAGLHLFFLASLFLKKLQLRHGFGHSFCTSFAPTLQIEHLTQEIKEQ